MTSSNRSNAPVMLRWARFLLAALACLASALAGCGESAPPSAGVEDATGTRVSVPQSPQRIVSLLPSATEGLFRLGMGDRVVGVTTYCTRPEEASERTQVGTFVKPEVETIVALKPDLVIAGMVGRPEPVYLLRSLGLPVFVLPQDKTLASVHASYATLGRLCGSEKKAGEDLGALAARMVELKSAICGRPEPRVFVQLGARPLITVGRETFVSDLLAQLGAVNLGDDIGGGYPRVDMESVLGLDPDVILITTMTGFPKEEKDRWLERTSLKASRARQVFLVNGDNLCRPDPFALADAADELAHLLHPDAFQDPEGR